MAYSASETRTGTHHRGVSVKLAETDGAPASEATISNLPLKGRVRIVRLEKSSGDAATFDPVVATSAGGTGNAIVAGDCGPAAAFNLIGFYPYETTDGTLYYRSRPDTGINNATNVELAFLQGW